MEQTTATESTAVSTSLSGQDPSLQKQDKQGSQSSIRFPDNKPSNVDSRRVVAGDSDGAIDGGNGKHTEILQRKQQQQQRHSNEREQSKESEQAKESEQSKKSENAKESEGKEQRLKPNPGNLRTPKLQILTARYESVVAPAVWKARFVTFQMQKLVGEGSKLIIRKSFNALFGDPTPDEPKQLVVTYRTDKNVVATKRWAEGSVVYLDVESDDVPSSVLNRNLYRARRRERKRQLQQRKQKQKQKLNLSQTQKQNQKQKQKQNQKQKQRKRKRNVESVTAAPSSSTQTGEKENFDSSYQNQPEYQPEYQSEKSKTKSRLRGRHASNASSTSNFNSNFNPSSISSSSSDPKEYDAEEDGEIANDQEERDRKNKKNEKKEDQRLIRGMKRFSISEREKQRSSRREDEESSFGTERRSSSADGGYDTEDEDNTGEDDLEKDDAEKDRVEEEEREDDDDADDAEDAIPAVNFGNIPGDAFMVILEFLPIAPDRLNCTMVCRSWYYNIVRFGLATEFSLGMAELPGPDYTNMSIDFIKMVVRRSKSRLKVLNLGRCSTLTDETLAFILPLVPRLKELGLTGCSLLTDESLSLIGEHCPQLTLLSLKRVRKVTDKTVMGIARGCPRLKCLNLNDCRLLTDSSIIELGRRLQLTVLHLKELNRVTTVGISALLRGNSAGTLQTLALWSLHLLTDDALLPAAHEVFLEGYDQPQCQWQIPTFSTHGGKTSFPRPRSTNFLRASPRLGSITPNYPSPLYPPPPMAPPPLLPPSSSSSSPSSSSSSSSAIGFEEEKFSGRGGVAVDSKETFTIGASRFGNAASQGTAVSTSAGGTVLPPTYDDSGVSALKPKSEEDNQDKENVPSSRMTSHFSSSHSSLSSLHSNTAGGAAATDFEAGFQYDGLSDSESTTAGVRATKVQSVGSLASLANAFGSVPALMHLRQLTLSGCHNINDEGIESICHCTGLVALNISYCHRLTDRSIRLIASRLRRLEHLNIAYLMKITDEPFIEAVESLEEEYNYDDVDADIKVDTPDLDLGNEMKDHSERPDEEKSTNANIDEAKTGKGEEDERKDEEKEKDKERENQEAREEERDMARNNAVHNENKSRAPRQHPTRAKKRSTRDTVKSFSRLRSLDVSMCKLSSNALLSLCYNLNFLSELRAVSCRQYDDKTISAIATACADRVSGMRKKPSTSGLIRKEQREKQQEQQSKIDSLSLSPSPYHSPHTGTSDEEGNENENENETKNESKNENCSSNSNSNTPSDSCFSAGVEHGDHGGFIERATKRTGSSSSTTSTSTTTRDEKNKDYLNLKLPKFNLSPEDASMDSTMATEQDGDDWGNKGRGHIKASKEGKHLSHNFSNEKEKGNPHCDPASMPVATDNAHHSDKDGKEETAFTNIQVDDDGTGSLANVYADTDAGSESLDRSSNLGNDNDNDNENYIPTDSIEAYPMEVLDFRKCRRITPKALEVLRKTDEVTEAHRNMPQWQESSSQTGFFFRSFEQHIYEDECT